MQLITSKFKSAMSEKYFLFQAKLVFVYAPKCTVFLVISNTNNTLKLVLNEHFNVAIA